MSPSIPSFIIIGAQKSASTFLQKCLSDHPDIYMPKEETPYFESPDYENAPLDYFEKLFNNKTEKCLGIKRPNYIGKKEVSDRIKNKFPESKLIAILRNPVDRSFSSYFHDINYGFIPVLDYESGIRKIISDKKYQNRYKRSGEILENGYYYKYLSMYDGFFQKNKILIFLYEDIVDKPLESIQKAYAFLDVDSNYIPKVLNSRPQKVIYNLKRISFIRLRNKFLYNYKDAETRVYINNSISGKLLSKLITLFDRGILSYIYSNDKPKLNNLLRKEIYNIYKEDIDLLEKLIGRDLSNWKYE